MKRKFILLLISCSFFLGCQQTVDPFQVDNCGCGLTKKMFFNSSNQYTGGILYSYDNNGHIFREDWLLPSDSTKIDPNNFKVYNYTNGALSSINTPGWTWTVTTENNGLITKISELSTGQQYPTWIFTYQYNGNRNLISRVAKNYNNSGILNWADSTIRSNYVNNRPQNLIGYFKNSVNATYSNSYSTNFEFDNNNTLTKLTNYAPNGTVTSVYQYTWDYTTKRIPNNSFIDEWNNPNFNSLDSDQYFQTNSAYVGYCNGNTETDNLSNQLIVKNAKGYPTGKVSTDTYNYVCNQSSTGSSVYTSKYYWNCCK